MIDPFLITDHWTNISWGRKWISAEVYKLKQDVDWRKIIKQLTVDDLSSKYCANFAKPRSMKNSKKNVRTSNRIRLFISEWENYARFLSAFNDLTNTLFSISRVVWKFSVRISIFVVLYIVSIIIMSQDQGYSAFKHQIYHACNGFLFKSSLYICYNIKSFGKCVLISSLELFNEFREKKLRKKTKMNDWMQV